MDSQDKPLSPSGPSGTRKRRLSPMTWSSSIFRREPYSRQSAGRKRQSRHLRARVDHRAEDSTPGHSGEGVRRRSNRYAPHEKLRLRPHLRSIGRATDREIAIKSELQPGHAGSSGKLPVREPLQERGAGNRFLVRRREGGNAIARRRFEPRGNSSSVTPRLASMAEKIAKRRSVSPPARTKASKSSTSGSRGRLRAKSRKAAWRHRKAIL